MNPPPRIRYPRRIDIPISVAILLLGVLLEGAAMVSLIDRKGGHSIAADYTWLKNNYLYGASVSVCHGNGTLQLVVGIVSEYDSPYSMLSRGVHMSSQPESATSSSFVWNIQSDNYFSNRGLKMGKWGLGRIKAYEACELYLYLPTSEFLLGGMITNSLLCIHIFRWYRNSGHLTRLRSGFDPVQ